MEDDFDKSKYVWSILTFVVGYLSIANAKTTIFMSLSEGLTHFVK